MATYQTSEDDSNYKEIEGLIVATDTNGFVKINIGSKWYIWVGPDSYMPKTNPEENPLYPQLGRIQVISLRVAGTWRDKDETTEQSLKDFFDSLKVIKPFTVSTTTTYKKLLEEE